MQSPFKKTCAWPFLKKYLIGVTPGSFILLGLDIMIGISFQTCFKHVEYNTEKWSETDKNLSKWADNPSTKGKV